MEKDLYSYLKKSDEIGENTTGFHYITLCGRRYKLPKRIYMPNELLRYGNINIQIAYICEQLLEKDLNYNMRNSNVSKN